MAKVGESAARFRAESTDNRADPSGMADPCDDSPCDLRAVADSETPSRTDFNRPGVLDLIANRKPESWKEIGRADDFADESHLPLKGCW
jgi:hypothetical protein